MSNIFVGINLKKFVYFGSKWCMSVSTDPTSTQARSTTNHITDSLWCARDIWLINNFFFIVSSPVGKHYDTSDLNIVLKSKVNFRFILWARFKVFEFLPQILINKPYQTLSIFSKPCWTLPNFSKRLISGKIFFCSGNLGYA